MYYGGLKLFFCIVTGEPTVKRLLKQNNETDYHLSYSCGKSLPQINGIKPTLIRNSNIAWIFAIILKN